MKEIKVNVNLTVNKEGVKRLSEELGKTDSVFITALILEILNKVHSECVEIGASALEMERYNPCCIWPKVDADEN